MPRISTILCDLNGCEIAVDILEDGMDPAIQDIIQIIDAAGNSFYFCTAEHAMKFLSTYKNPYLQDKPKDLGDGLN